MSPDPLWKKLASCYVRERDLLLSPRVTALRATVAGDTGHSIKIKYI